MLFEKLCKLLFIPCKIVKIIKYKKVLISNDMFINRFKYKPQCSIMEKCKNTSQRKIIS